MGKAARLEFLKTGNESLTTGTYTVNHRLHATTGRKGDPHGMA